MPEVAGCPLVKFPWNCVVTAEDARPCDLMSQPVWPCWGKGVEGTLRQKATGRCSARGGF